MSLASPLVICAIFFAVLGLFFLIIAIGGIRKRKLFTSALNVATALLMLSLFALFSTVSFAIQTYHALTAEELAATIKIEPTGVQKFTARVALPDGSEKTFSLAGDQLYIDAHILKWKPLANMFGLHTSYELDRVAGRYALLNDEVTKARTVYSLAKDNVLNMYDLRQKFSMLNPLLDAQYGSATFINSNSAEEFRVMVSTTGLLIRKVEKEPSKAKRSWWGGNQ